MKHRKKGYDANHSLKVFTFNFVISTNEVGPDVSFSRQLINACAVSNDVCDKGYLLQLQIF